MNYENRLDFLKKILLNCHIQTFELDLSGKGISEVNAPLLETLPEINDKTVYRVTDAFFCRFIVLKIKGEKDLLIIGPYLSEDIGEKELFEQGERSGLSPRVTEELKGYYASLPTLKEDFCVMAMVLAFAEELWGDNFEVVDVARENSSLFVSSDLEMIKSPDSTKKNVDAMEQRYNYENELIVAVSQGNLQKAESMIMNFSTLAFENRISDQLRSFKNYSIIMNTLLRKAAERGGVHPVFLDSVSSGFAKRIETIHSVSANQDFMLEMLRTYCRLVKRHSVKDYSLLVQKAVVQIESDLASDLTLNNMAKMANVSPAYFSSLFKKETGKTLTDFVNSRRVSMAKHLLKTTTLQVQTVAQHCGILDFHYFCRLFKKYVGKTPTEYREGFTIV